MMKRVIDEITFTRLGETVFFEKLPMYINILCQNQTQNDYKIYWIWKFSEKDPSPSLVKSPVIVTHWEEPAVLPGNNPRLILS
jgi:hypothetical protein